MRGLSASGEEASGEGLDGADNPAGGHGLAGRDAIFLLATIAQQLTRIADAAERITGSAAMPQQGESMPKHREEETPDQLLAILGDKQLYDQIVLWAHTCVRRKDIANRIAPMLRQSGFRKYNKDFIIALLPHLTNYTGATKNYKNMLSIFY